MNEQLAMCVEENPSTKKLGEKGVVYKIISGDFSNNFFLLEIDGSFKVCLTSRFKAIPPSPIPLDSLI